jgi:CHAT domain-containing protein
MATDLVRTCCAAIVAIVSAGGLTACQVIGGPEETRIVAGDVVLVGNNLIGEPCRAQPRRAEAAEPAAKGETYDVFCGRWEQPSGTVIRLPATDVSSLADAMARSSWRQRLDLRAICQAEQPSTILTGIKARVMDCKLRGGGWPFAAFGTEVNDTVFLASGIPAVQPNLEAAIGILSGDVPRDVAAGGTVGTRSVAVQRLEAQLAGRLFGTGDLIDYQQLRRIGQYYNSVKNYAAAEAKYRQALEIHQRLLGVDDPESGDPLMHLALELSNQERFAEADRLFQRAGSLLAGAIDPADYARYVNYLALHEANQNKYAEAIARARESTALRRTIATPTGAVAAGDQLGTADTGVLTTPGDIAAVDLAQSLYTEARLLLILGDVGQAEYLSRDAHTIVEKSPAAPPWWNPQILELQAEIAETHQQYYDAEHMLQIALVQREQLFGPSRPEGLTWLTLGRIHRDQGETGPALDAFRKGVKIIGEAGVGTGLRFDQIQPYLETLLAETERRPGDRAALHAEMFDAAQRVRSPIAAQSITQAAARLSNSERSVGAAIRSLEDARIDRFEQFRDFNAAAAAATGLPEDKRRVDGLRERIRALDEQIADLEQQVQAAAPNYNQLIDRPIEPERIVELLGRDEALVQILLGDTASYVFVVRNTGITAKRLDVSKDDVAKAVEHLRGAFEVQGGSIGKFDAARAHALYRELLGPVEDQLAGVTHLVTVPSGPLLALPFGLLVTKPPPAVSGFDYRNVAWLLRSTAISLAPSARSFVDLRALALPSRAANPILAFADFIPSGDPDVILRSRDLPPTCRDEARRIAQAPRLADTAEEARATAASLGAGSESVILGEAFSDAAVRSLPLDRYRVLLFATHGLLPTDLQCLSEPALLTSVAPHGGKETDGMLTTSEIIDLRLDAEMVVLSACDTGGEGAGTGGESLSGLARAFFFAGARSMLVSHWEVATNATTALTTRTFANLAQPGKQGSSWALRTAQLSLADAAGTSHPFFWAAFTLVGDGAGTLHGVDAVAERQPVAERLPARR